MSVAMLRISSYPNLKGGLERVIGWRAAFKSNHTSNPQSWHRKPQRTSSGGAAVVRQNSVGM